ncbi:ArsC family reductase [Aliiglaciecola sp. CAU 1673]|uniref:ArsC family reductase n=1 Tax=Aliiglaciecola sp. CAU 1673 TaxID=3032595 RepID=UPI0023DB682B|nr:ArsC family reductase [Aliiglaciecola sp. CAU 1673]MDF2177741.1 ArsC family reductase [Aliiglaciecola sp. CAU 1673]
MITLYGIKNCDTIKKARQWLESQDIDYQFHDYRQQGLEKAWFENVCQKVGWETLLNTRGTTFRQLDETQKADLNEQKAIALMLAHPAMIKRPLLVNGDTYQVGFKPQQYEQLFHGN